MEQSRFDARERARAIAKQSLEQGDATGWFEKLYVEAQGDESRVPWADRDGHPLLTEWLATQRVLGRGRRALVIGCGLGEDCEALAGAGFDVTGFDISPTAVAWCAQRFAGSRVRYQVADLLAPPSAWGGAFEFVFECYTLQALPPAPRELATRNIASFVAPGGELLVVMRGRNADEDTGQLPWPLTCNEIRAFQAHGMSEVSFEDLESCGPVDKPGRHFRALFRAP